MPPWSMWTGSTTAACTGNWACAHPPSLKRFWPARPLHCCRRRPNELSLYKTRGGSSATMSLNQGTHPRIVQARLGHSSIAMTMDLYSHASMALGAEEADKLENLVRRPREQPDSQAE